MSSKLSTRSQAHRGEESCVICTSQSSRSDTAILPRSVYGRRLRHVLSPRGDGATTITARVHHASVASWIAAIGVTAPRLPRPGGNRYAAGSCEALAGPGPDTPVEHWPHGASIPCGDGREWTQNPHLICARERQTGGESVGPATHLKNAD
jgi:hypothetical protein